MHFMLVDMVHFGVNGKYFLVKLYISEFIEQLNQLYAVSEIYLCFTPLRITIFIYVVLTLELVANLWINFHLRSQEMRNRLILIDILQCLLEQCLSETPGQLTGKGLNEVEVKIADFGIDLAS